MKRKIYLEVEFDWDDYDDVCDELLLEDSGIMDNMKDGLSINLCTVSSGIKQECMYEPDNSTGMNCKHCGDPKWTHLYSSCERAD